MRVVCEYLEGNRVYEIPFSVAPRAICSFTVDVCVPCKVQLNQVASSEGISVDWVRLLLFQPFCDDLSIKIVPSDVQTGF